MIFLQNKVHLLDRNRLARQKFIFYYERGESELKWKRPFGVYYMWTFLDDPDKIDYELFDLWAKVCEIYPSNYQYEEVLYQFDIIERMLKLHAFF